MARPILAMDFDGVICDSTEECVVTAWNAWKAYNGDKDRVRATDEVPEPFRTAIRTLRSYVRTAGEYLLLIEAARTSRNIRSQSDYDAVFEEFRSAIKPYGELFFAVREDLRRDEPYWLSLHEVYRAMPESLHKVSRHFELFVVTGKDSKSVQIFFERFNLPLKPSQIYDKDVAHDKLSAIRMIAGNAGQSLNSTVFVDDNIHHLMPAHTAGCLAFMAGWGYHTAEQIELARKNSIPILELDSWADALLRRKVSA